MRLSTYEAQRGRVEAYFDRTAAETWTRLTSDAPVSGIRATVRAGREEMRTQILSRLPARLDGCRVLDAGCGTGALACELAARGADVVGVDLAPAMIEVAVARAPEAIREACGGRSTNGSVAFHAGDMLDTGHGRFDFVVSMDCLIHYGVKDTVAALEGLSARTTRGILFTFAPRTPALALMHTAGKLFPRGDRSPAITPVSEGRLRRMIGESEKLCGWTASDTARVSRGFYTSQVMRLVRR
ncbi:MAG: magnesium protoporphyrin IX methyltransferase [Pseudomonadota bacterium]